MKLTFKNGVLDGQEKHVDGDWSKIERIGVTDGGQMVDTYRLARVIDNNTREFHQVDGLVINVGASAPSPEQADPSAKDRLLAK